MKKLLSGNEAIALGAYHSGVRVATAYPGTPSTEILEYIARFPDIYAEWSTNEKVAMEVAMGASYAGVRTITSMKQVGLNVAVDPFMAAAVTGVRGGLVVVSADDPGTHSSQCEQDNRYYAKFAQVPALEPSDSQEAYNLMPQAFDISEEFDTPVMLRTTTRLSHSKSVVTVNRERSISARPTRFDYDFTKFVMLPVNARSRGHLIIERMAKLRGFADRFSFNRIEWGDRRLGIVTSGVAYQYAREVFPKASYLKLGMIYPLPENLLREFAGKVDRLIVIEELSPFLEESIIGLGINAAGKEFIPALGELNPAVIETGARNAGLLKTTVHEDEASLPPMALPNRPPLLCPGCPHTGLFFILSTIGGRNKGRPNDRLIITGDIGCYTLGAYPPLSALDTCACMGASIGQAIGMAKAGVGSKVVAVIGDSTFLHSGITGLVNAVYDGANITLIILDNSTTAMTGHQQHPGTGLTVQGKPAPAVILEDLVRGLGVSDVSIVNAFDLKKLRATINNSLASTGLSVIIVRGSCAVLAKRAETRVINSDICTDCGSCLLLGCSAIQKGDDITSVDSSLCIGCTVCEQVCPKHAIVPKTKNGG